MIFSKQVYLWFIFTIHIIVGNHINKTFEQEINAKRFLSDVNNQSLEIVSKLVRHQWNSEMNTTLDANNIFISSDSLENRKYIFEQVKLYYPWKNFTDPDVRRKLKLFSEIGILALSPKDYESYQKIISEVSNIERHTVICDFSNKSKCDLHLQPDIEEKLKTSQNSDELLYLHKEWHKATKDKIIPLFKNYIVLSNRAAKLNNYTNFKKYSLRNIEMNDVKKELISLWDKIRPLYEQLHAYVRRKLMNIYGDKILSSTGPIPAHLLGKMRLENWSGLSKKIVPFPEVDNLNITGYMLQKKYTLDTIHHLAEEFFKSMNISVNYNFWVNNSTKQSEINRCQNKIFNFYDGYVRIMGCNDVSLKNFLMAHNLVTKAHYMVQYSKQPYVYQMPADPALEIAINDIIAMSASTFSNFKRIGLFEKEINKKIRINKLFKLALEKVAALPFLLVQELWRWKLFEGMAIEEILENLQSLREKFQGVVFPLELGSGFLERNAFSEISLVHHFLGYLLEFQIYDNLCNDEINFDECNLADNKGAGRILRKLMSSGSSKSLKETLADILNESKIKARSILKFFKPLMHWLKEQNKINEYYIGWKNNLTTNKSKRRKRSAADYFSEHNDEDDTFNAASKILNKFQRSVPLKAKNNEKEFKLSTRIRKNVRNGVVGEVKNKNSIVIDEKIKREIDKTISNTQNSINVKDTKREGSENNEKEMENDQKSFAYSKLNFKRQAKGKKNQINLELNYQSNNIENNKREINSYKKKRNSYGPNKIKINLNENNDNEIDTGSNANYDKNTSDKKEQKKRRHYVMEAVPAINNWQNPYESNFESNSKFGIDSSRHMNSKKDISRLLHSFGFTIETEEKDKVKDMKKKLKGDSNPSLKNEVASKESGLDNLLDYSKIKSGDSRNPEIEEKGGNKLWAIKSYLTENAKSLPGSNPLSRTLNKKDSLSSSQMTSALSKDEKNIDKKEILPHSGTSDLKLNKEGVIDSSEKQLTRGDPNIKTLNLDSHSLQVLFKNSDLNSLGPKSIIALTPEISEKIKNDNQMISSQKQSPSKLGNSYLYKYSSLGDTVQFKDKKDYKEENVDVSSKSPYVIILGQISPDMKDTLMKYKGSLLMDLIKQSQLQGSTSENQDKLSEKKNRALSQIFIVPIDLKSSQQNLMKGYHFTEQEHEGGHDSNIERDQETEEEQLRLEDKSNLYKNNKDNPSEFIISWNDKNRKIVKRSKRDRDKEVLENQKVKVVRLAPMKESVLESLFSKSNQDSRPGSLRSLTSSNSDRNPPHANAIQSSALSSLASSVLSALSPKTLSQTAKTANSHQETNIDESNMKGNSNVQVSGKDVKEQELPFLSNSGLRCNPLIGSKKKGAILYSDEEKKNNDNDNDRSKTDDCNKKIILTPCTPKCPCPCPCPLPCPCPITCAIPCAAPCNVPNSSTSPSPSSSTPSTCTEEPSKPNTNSSCSYPDLCKKPCECSLVNCQFKITKAKKPQERLTIMIYDRINSPAELPEPYDALSVISEILQRIQNCPCKANNPLTEEDPDYPSNDNIDQLKENPNQSSDPNKLKVQGLSGNSPNVGNEAPEDDETDDNASNAQSDSNSSDQDKYQPKEKATPAVDQLTVFNKDKFKPVYIDLRKLDDIIKRSQTV